VNTDKHGFLNREGHEGREENEYLVSFGVLGKLCSENKLSTQRFTFVHSCIKMQLFIKLTKTQENVKKVKTLRQAQD